MFAEAAANCSLAEVMPVPPVLHKLLSQAASHPSLPLVSSCHITEKAEVADVEET